MGQDSVCKKLDWDTEFFGVKIARASLSHLTPESLKEIFSWCRAQGIECLYFLCDSDDAESVRLCEQNDFDLVDKRETFEYQIGKSGCAIPERNLTGKSVRFSRQDDIPVLRKIARDIYHHTRFYHDSHFTKEKASDLYMTWIEKSCNGYADIVLVLTVKERPSGYITCNIAGSETGRISLVGIEPSLQSSGAGQLLIHSTLDWFKKQGVNKIEVATQARNKEAQRLYQRCGFLAKNTQSWYHKWFKQ